jgi:hypothetical protein
VCPFRGLQVDAPEVRSRHGAIGTTVGWISGFASSTSWSVPSVTHQVKPDRLEQNEPAPDKTQTGAVANRDMMAPLTFFDR